jgi:AAA domain
VAKDITQTRDELGSLSPESIRGAIVPFQVSDDQAPAEDSQIWLQPKVVSELTNIQPGQILRGIVYKRGKVIVMGGSKSYKTWTLMDIAFCVGNGLLWWGTHTTQCPVVYLDFELIDYDFRWRMEQIASAYGRGSIDVVKRIGLRGKTLKADHWSKIYENVCAVSAGLVVADPTYKLLGPNRDENAAGDIAQVTAIFERLTEATGASVIYAQHFSKGNQAGKESIDRGAGSGVWARDADAIITMTKHQEGDDCLTIETTLRSFPRIDPFVVRWNFPLFQRAPELDPADLKQPSKRGGSSPKYSVKDLVECLGNRQLTTSEFQRLANEETGMSKAVFYRLLPEAEKSGVLHKSRVDSKWEVVSGH